MTKLSDEEIEKLLKTLPPELKTAVFSEDSAESIRRICERNKIKENEVPSVATLVGNVLIGILPPEEFPKKLQEGLGTDETTTRRISQEANRLIFYPVQASLNKLYGKAKPAEAEKKKGAGVVVAPEAAEKAMKEVALAAKTPTREPVSGPDVYREPVETE